MRSVKSRTAGEDGADGELADDRHHDHVKEVRVLGKEDRFEP